MPALTITACAIVFVGAGVDRRLRRDQRLIKFGTSVRAGELRAMLGPVVLTTLLTPVFRSSPEGVSDRRAPTLSTVGGIRLETAAGSR